VHDPLLPGLDDAALAAILADAADRAAALWLARRRPGQAGTGEPAALPGPGEAPLPLAALAAELTGMLAAATPSGADPLDFAHIPSTGNAAALVADWFAAALNVQTASAALAPHGVALERAVIARIAAFLGYGQATGGLLTGGSSLANLVALTAARDAALPEAGRAGLAGTAPVRIYASRAVHACIGRAASVLGLGRQALVDASAQDPDHIDPEKLQGLVQADRAAGRRPLAIVATVGTAATGAIDPLDELAVIARQERLWLHVDGAFGAAAAAIEPPLATAMAQADSVALDLHKGLFLPYETGCLLVRDAGALAASFAFTADYLAAPEDARDPMQLGPELSRGLRALRIWATFRCIGEARLRAALCHCMDLAHWLHEAVASSALLEAAAPTRLSIVCLRLRGSRELATAHADALHLECLRRLADGSAAMRMSAVRHAGRIVLRACFVNPRTRRAEVQQLFERLESLAGDVMGITGHPPPVTS
jgi:glutamate/tyrosine decarboxylase-like PLP-dependent enzyme